MTSNSVSKTEHSYLRVYLELWKSRAELGFENSGQGEELGVGRGNSVSTKAFTSGPHQILCC